MGIYDNWRQEYSNTVPTFVPDNSDKVAKYIEEANKRYETTQDYLNVTGEALRTAPISSKDQRLYSNLNQEVHAKIQELSKRPDLENATREAYKLAEATKTRLSGLVQRQAQEQSYAKNLSDMVEKGKLDEGTKARLLAMSDDKSTETEFDEYGRVLGGFNPVPAAANVDRIEKIQKFLNKVAGEKINVSRSGDGDVKYTNEQGIEVKLPENLILQLKASLELDPEIQAMDSRDAMLSAHEATRGITDETVLNTLQYSPRTGEDALWQAKIKEAIERGVPPAEAAKQVEYARHLNAINSREMQLALGESYRNITDKQDSGPGVWAVKDRELADWQSKEEYKQQHGSSEYDNASSFVGQGMDVTVDSWASTGKDLQTKISDLNDLETSLDSQIKEYQITVNDSKAPLESKLRAKAEIAKLEDQKLGLNTRKSQIEQGNNTLLENASQELYKTPWTKIKEQEETDLKSSLKKLYPKGIKTSDGGTMLIDDVVKAYLSGKVKVKESKVKSSNDKFLVTQYDTEINGKTVPTRTLFDKLSLKTPRMTAVLEKSKEMSTKGLALKTTAVPITSETDKKALKDIVHGVTLYDMSGSEVITPSEDVDWSKTEIGAYMPEVKKVEIRLSDGTTALADVSRFSFHKNVGDKLSKSIDPYTRQLGNAIKSDNIPVYQRVFNQASGLITVHPVTKKPIKVKDNNYGVLRNNDGTFSIVDTKKNEIESDGERLLSNLSFYELTNFLDAVK